MWNDSRFNNNVVVWVAAHLRSTLDTTIQLMLGLLNH